MHIVITDIQANYYASTPNARAKRLCYLQGPSLGLLAETWEAYLVKPSTRCQKERNDTNAISMAWTHTFLKTVTTV